MPMVIYSKRLHATPKEFVEFWKRLYEYKDEYLYTDNIGLELTDQRILDLFKWKIGDRFWQRGEAIVCANFINQQQELERIGSNRTTAELLAHFPNGGAIYRIFWLHCWNPTRFPIYDQHVYRAMKFIQTGRPQEIPTTDNRKIATYTGEYLPFFATFDDPNNPYVHRDVDKALWAFGKFLSDAKLREAFDI